MNMDINTYSVTYLPPLPIAQEVAKRKREENVEIVSSKIQKINSHSDKKHKSPLYIKELTLECSNPQIKTAGQSIFSATPQ